MAILRGLETEEVFLVIFFFQFLFLRKIIIYLNTIEYVVPMENFDICLVKIPKTYTFIGILICFVSLAFWY